MAVIVAVILYLSFAVQHIDGLKCYTCEDTGDVQTGNNIAQCYNIPVPLAKTVDCPDSKFNIGHMGLRWTDRNRELTGYCAVWIQQTKFHRDGQDGIYTYWNRGCVYPGGEPNEPVDCLIAEESPGTYWRKFTAQYCRSDLCNSEPFADFVNRCYGAGSNATLTTRDFNNINATLVPPVSPPTITIDPKIDALLKARAENLTSGTGTIGDNQKGAGVRLAGFADTLTAFLLVCSVFLYGIAVPMHAFE